MLAGWLALVKGPAHPLADGPTATVAGKVRPGTLADLDSLVALEVLCFPGDRMSRRSFHRLLQRPSALVLVCDPGAPPLLGYALLLWRSDTDVARLYSLARAPDPTARGLGAVLLAAAEAAARTRGSRELRLEVRSDNAAALRLYGASGYRLFGRHERFYEDGTDALRLRKPLEMAGDR